MQQQISFQPLGFLESCYKDKFGVPRQAGLVPAATARLKLRADLQPEQALEGIEGFSHIWLVTVFHENRTARPHAKVHPPRLGGKTLGVFATRSPHRPNPIGLSLVELVRVDKDSIWVSGVDLMDGTPVLDIKPYLPEIESKPEARAGWAEGLKQMSLEVSFSDQAEREMSELQARHPQVRVREIITDTIRLDPRPLVYRGGEEGFQRRPNHAFRLLDGDVHFRITAPERAEVFTILQWNHEIPPANLPVFTPYVKTLGIENEMGD